MVKFDGKSLGDSSRKPILQLSCNDMIKVIMELITSKYVLTILLTSQIHFGFLLPLKASCLNCLCFAMDFHVVKVHFFSKIDNLSAATTKSQVTMQFPIVPHSNAFDVKRLDFQNNNGFQITDQEVKFCYFKSNSTRINNTSV